MRNSLIIFIALLWTGVSHAQDSLRRVKLKDTALGKVDTLKTATVIAARRPRLNGDTVEFNTNHIRLRPHAEVEELLGQLPGLQIDPDGNITFNGEKIQHLLVDGEDIFGNSPALVTRNFDASKIAKIQILDRVSDQSRFTGVDDGTRVKTLNLVLKESAKDGYFGKAEAGADPGGYYHSDAALAGFKANEQFTALLAAANDGAGLTGGAAGAQGDEGAQSKPSDPMGASAGVGIPRFGGLALHYANNWKPTGSHAAGNYQYSHVFTQPVTFSQVLQTQAGSVFGQSQQSRSTNRQDLHWWFGTYEWKSRSKDAFKIAIGGSTFDGGNQFNSNGTSSFNNDVVNNSRLGIRDQQSQQKVSGEAYWRRPIGRPERAISAVFTFNKTNSSTNGYLFSVGQFYQSGGTISSQDTVDQRKELNNRPLSLTGSLNFTQPMWRKTSLDVSYSLSSLTDRSFQGTFANSGDKYNTMVDSLTSDYGMRSLLHQVILNFNHNDKKLFYLLSMNWLADYVRQKDILGDSTLHLRYINWLPRAWIYYHWDANTGFWFRYSASYQPPKFAQLQPAKNNIDPLHLVLGNPNLKPAYSHFIEAEYRRSGTWNIFAGLVAELTDRNISIKTTTDNVGRQKSLPVNVDGGRRVALRTSLSRKLLGIETDIWGGIAYSKSFNYVNADLSRNTSYTDNGGFSLKRNVPDKYIFQVSTNFTYFTQLSSINTSTSVHYWSQSHSGAVTIFLFRNCEFNTNAAYTWQQRTNAFSSNTSVLLWNTAFSRNFLQNRLVVKAQINNILNANSGITRTNINNVTTETSTNILGRYWMFFVIYHFDRKLGRK